MFDNEVIIEVRFTPPVEEAKTGRFEVAVHPGASLETVVTGVALTLAKLNEYGHSQFEIMGAFGRAAANAKATESVIEGTAQDVGGANPNA